jgi:hypothetical protein
MKVNRIVLTLVLAGLAAPALAEKCHICDFSDEPIVVKPTKAVGPTPLAMPGGLAAAPDSAPGRRTYEPILIQKRIDKSAPMGGPALKGAAPVGPATRR